MHDDFFQPFVRKNFPKPSNNNERKITKKKEKIIISLFRFSRLKTAAKSSLKALNQIKPRIMFFPFFYAWLINLNIIF